MAPNGSEALPSGAGGVVEAVEACLEDLDDVAVAYERKYAAVSPPGISPDGLPLDPKLKRHIEQTYPRGLFTHQFDGLASVLGGKHTVLTTQTSSGKSLIFSLPAFNAFLEDDTATSLFIYPQKALANDQLAKLRELYEGVKATAPNATIIARYDGATPDERKPELRTRSQFVLTNPDMLHLAFLQYHEKWARFFSRLRYVIVDEAHTYRGIFGSSVAFVLRRLRAICSYYGSCPVFVSASATIAEATKHLRRLTGLEFEEIGPDRDGSVQGMRKLWLLRSPVHHYQLGRNLTRLFVDRGLSCLTFCPSRVSAERLLTDIADVETSDGTIRVYRAGLDSREREEIEAGLRDGRIRGVFSTSALEIGIDIGELDVVLCVGLPNTMMSLWQRAGRVGRSAKEGAIVFLAGDTPLDTYFAEHPEELFERENEPLAVNLTNRRLVSHHLACAIQETPAEGSLDIDVLGEEMAHAIELRHEGRFVSDVFYVDDPHMQTPIRNADARNYAIAIGDEKIGEIDSWHLLREAYPKAIYLHGGRPYRVTNILTGERLIRVRPERTRNLTNPVIRTSISTRRVRAVTEYSDITIKMAEFDVTERLIAVQEKSRGGETVRQYSGSGGLRPHRLPTEGVCIELSPALTGELAEGIARSRPGSTVQAVGRLFRSLFPVISGPCDRMDFNEYAEYRGGRMSWYLYDQVHDGIGLTVQVYPRVPELAEKASDRVRSCNCQDDEGCFRCIKNPDQEEAVSKQDCIFVLGRLCNELGGEEPKSTVFNIDVLEEQSEAGTCPKCGADVNYGDNFCGNCGERLTG